MSRVLACHVLVPQTERVPAPLWYEHHGGGVGVERSLAIEEEVLNFELPQPRSAGALSRAGLLMIAAALRCQGAVAAYVAQDSSRVGVYSAVENGPDHFEQAILMVGTDPEAFVANYRSGRSPKQHFRFLANVPGSYISIFLGLEGPLHVFTSSLEGVAHALAQAEFDLAYGTVSAAVVCSAFSLESPLISVRSAMDAPAGHVLCEGAGCVVLVADERRSEWLQDLGPGTQGRFFGIADPLIRLCEQKSTDGGRLDA